MQSFSILVLIFERIEKRLQSHELGKAQQEVSSALRYDSKNYFAKALKRRLSSIMHIGRNSQQSFYMRNSSFERTMTALQHLCQMARKSIIQQHTGELEMNDE